MKERPILFSGQMIRAILDGSKTMTRRVVKPQPVSGISIDPIKREWVEGIPHCPYGYPGDRLWVRETWRVEGKHTDGYSPSCIGANRSHFGRIDYEASIAWNKDMYGKLRPSIHMPRWASRITLEVTGVRVERLQDITEADAEAEGVAFMRDIPDADETLTAKVLFEILWDSINAKRGYGWDVNPWVWVVEFRRVKQ
jgi:hypothetical protein